MTLSFQHPSRSSSPYHLLPARSPVRIRRALLWSVVAAFLAGLFFSLGCNSTIHTHGGWVRKQLSRQCTVCPCPPSSTPASDPLPERTFWPPSESLPVETSDPPSFNDYSENPQPSLPTVAPQIHFSEPPLSLDESASLESQSTLVPLLVIHFP